MKSVLHKDIVLVVNRGWVVINVITVLEAVKMMISDAATGFDVEKFFDDEALDFSQSHGFTPTKWEDWHKLPVREHDDFITTPRQKVRVPRVIMAVNFAGVPQREKKATANNLLEHYGGVCAITGVKLTKKTFSREHVIPRSKWKGDKRKRDGWENVVPAHRDVNSKRGNRTYKEAGLPEPKIKPKPRAKTASEIIRNVHKFPEWEFFGVKA